MRPAGADGQWMKGWAAIQPGQPVRLRHGEEGHCIQGVLDTQTEDGSVVWVQMDNGAGRRLIHRDDGYRLAGAGE
ncbi:hypothetical protein [Arthrobacter monumenti]